MLENLLMAIHNWFPVKNGIYTGTFSVSGNVLDVDFLQDGQFYRIKGSIFNDGLHMYGNDILHDEEFEGEVWALKVPSAVVSLSEEIEEWQKKQPVSDKTSESFGGYSYSRAVDSNGLPAGWMAAFGNRLNMWRKPYD